MYTLCAYVKCIYHFRGPHGRLAVTLCSYVFAKCCVPLKKVFTYLCVAVMFFIMTVIRGGSRISGKRVHKYKGEWFALLILSHRS